MSCLVLPGCQGGLEQSQPPGSVCWGDPVLSAMHFQPVKVGGQQGHRTALVGAHGP